MTRISTSTFFDQAVFDMNRTQAALFQTQNQLSTGKRVAVPSDDPVAAARSLEVQQAQAITAQYSTNGNSANSALGLSDNALSQVTALIQSLQSLVVNAGDGSLTPQDLKSLAAQVQGQYQELLGQANSTDGNGQYLFSGFKGSVQPFAETSPGVVAYAGDQGARLIQITASRQIPISDSGSDIFQAIKTGNGTFTTAAAASNAGSAIVSPGTVTDPAAWSAAANPKDFTIKFAVDNTQNPPVTTYDIVDNTTGNSLLTGAPSGAGPYLRTYTPGATISLQTQSPPDTNPTPFDYGATLAITGQPADGDTFTVKASGNQDIFTTVSDLITALQNGGTGEVANAALTNQLNTASLNLSNALNNVLRVRAAIGARVNEAQSAQTAQSDLSVQYQTTVSNLTDLDYTKAISELTQQQLSLQAAQQTFAKVQGLSLFNFL